MPLPGIERRTVARVQTFPVGKPTIRSIVEPLANGFNVFRYTPPSPIVSTYAKTFWPADFQPAKVPLGTLTRGYFRRFSVLSTVIGYSLMCHRDGITIASSSCSGGYEYSDGYVVTAVPITVGTTGQRGFCTDATGVIRFNASGIAGYTTPYCTTTQNPLQ